MHRPANKSTVPSKKSKGERIENNLHLNYLYLFVINSFMDFYSIEPPPKKKKKKYKSYKKGFKRKGRNVIKLE